MWKPWKHIMNGPVGIVLCYRPMEIYPSLRAHKRGHNVGCRVIFFGGEKRKTLNFFVQPNVYRIVKQDRINRYYNGVPEAETALRKRKPRPVSRNRVPEAETPASIWKVRPVCRNCVPDEETVSNSMFNLNLIFPHLAFYLNLCSASFLESQSHISIPKTPDLKLPLIFKL